MSLRSDTYLPETVELQSLVVEINQDLLRRGILPDLAIQVETDHITSRHVRSHLESFLESFLLSSSEVGFSHVNSEENGSIGMVLLVVLPFSTLP
jgi:hypothetical protein